MCTRGACTTKGDRSCCGAAVPAARVGWSWPFGRFGYLLVAIPGFASVIRRVAGVSAVPALPMLFGLVMSEEIAGRSGRWMA
jgi:hypothetical protein